MKRPDIAIQRKYKTDYNDKSVFAANARLLQSIWREEKGIPLKRIFGNYLSLKQAYCEEFNFLSQKIKDEVRKVVDGNELRDDNERKVIKTDRLYENLLASQPLAFNLFAELITPGYEVANKVFKKLFGDRIRNITSIEFEISPGRRNLRYTGDRSAFDVFIKYIGKQGNGFIGIEVKYAETLLDEPAKIKDKKYKEVAEKSGKFTEEGITELCKMPVSLEQIWRDHLLSLSMLPPVNNDYAEGFFVYLFPKENLECSNALNRYSEFLKSKNKNENGLHILFMQDVVDAIKIETNANWIRDFEDRYLRFDKIEKYS